MWNVFAQRATKSFDRDIYTPDLTKPVKTWPTKVLKLFVFGTIKLQRVNEYSARRNSRQTRTWCTSAGSSDVWFWQCHEGCQVKGCSWLASFTTFWNVSLKSFLSKGFPELIVLYSPNKFVWCRQQTSPSSSHFR